MLEHLCNCIGLITIRDIEIRESTTIFFMVVPCIDDVKFFISPTNVHKIILDGEIIKTIKIIKLPQHVSVSINHQGATTSA
jgi:hypothetical protein